MSGQSRPLAGDPSPFATLRAKGLFAQHDMLGQMTLWQQLPILVVKVHNACRIKLPTGVRAFMWRCDKAM